MANVESVIGGAGFDTVRLSTEAGVPANPVTVQDVEVVIGSANSDTIVVANTAGITNVTGGGGLDFMTASSGQDRFHFESISDSAAGIDRDRITGFDAATDQFVFGFAAPIYIGAEDFNGDGHSEARLVNMGELDILQIDVGGDGGVDMELQLVGLNGPLTDDNFLGQF